MKITKVTVGIHEKKANPYEHGNYDCSVTLEAEIGEGESAREAVSELRGAAHLQVKAQISRWLQELLYSRLQEKLRGQFNLLIDRILYSSSEADVARYAEEAGALLEDTDFPNAKDAGRELEEALLKAANTVRDTQEIPF